MNKILSYNEKYIELFEYINNIKEMDYNTFFNQKNDIIKKLNDLLSRDNVNINDLIIDHHSIHRYYTLLIYLIYNIQNIDIIEFILNKFNNEITIKFNNNINDVNQTTILYEMFKFGSKSSDSILPLVYLLEDIEYISIMDPKKKESHLNYLIQQIDNYKVKNKKEFLSLLKKEKRKNENKVKQELNKEINLYFNFLKNNINDIKNKKRKNNEIDKLIDKLKKLKDL